MFRPRNRKKYNNHITKEKNRIENANTPTQGQDREIKRNIEMIKDKVSIRKTKRRNNNVLIRINLIEIKIKKRKGKDPLHRKEHFV